jgi:uncharacterized protein
MKEKGKRRRGGRPDPRALKEIVRRIIEVAHPEKIVLFGSAARGEMNSHSDVDLLVIKKGRFHKGRLTEKIYMNLYGSDEAVDVVVVTPEEVELYRNTHCLVIAPALKEGKVLYAA